MLQLLYILRNSPVVIPLKMFQVINTTFCAPILHTKTLRIKIEQLQKPKESDSLALPNLAYMTWKPSTSILLEPCPKQIPTLMQLTIFYTTCQGWKM